jgi:hypothetical protein
MNQETEDKMLNRINEALLQKEYADPADIAGLNALQRDYQSAELRKKVADLELDLLAHKIEIVRFQFTSKYKMQGLDSIDSKTGLITRNS